MPKITEHNVETNEILTRDMTADEIAVFEANQLANELEKQTMQQVAAKRLAALAKLQTLGLDEDDLKALGL